MSEVEFPDLGYKTADGKGWRPPSEDEALDEVRDFLGDPRDQEGVLQIAAEDDFDYFQERAPVEESHNRIWLCSEALHEHLDESAPHGFKGGFSQFYVAATVNDVTDDRLIAWRNKPEDPKYLAEAKGAPMGLSSAQHLHQMVTWSKSRGMETLLDVNYVLDTMGADHEDVLNFVKNFKSHRQHSWGSMSNLEK